MGNAVALNLEQAAHLTTLDAWSAPYRSESFAEDLPLAALPLSVAAKPRWRAALLLALPLMVAVLGGLLPLVSNMA